MGWIQTIVEKLNPAQPIIVRDTGEEDYPSNTITFENAYNALEVVNRGVNYVVDAAGPINIDVGQKINNLGLIRRQIDAKRLHRLLNYAPNKYQNAESFRRLIYLDLLLEGNSFVYWDGSQLYILPAKMVKVIKDKKNFIKKYVYNEEVDFLPEEIIHIKDNSSKSIYRGTSRLKAADRSIEALSNMFTFHNRFFKNGTIPGLILKTPNILSEKVKDRILQKWQEQYNPRSGGRRPIILDGDFSIDTLGAKDLRELDFLESIKEYERKILKAIGVPPILIDSGNNANINPNIRLFYTGTVFPLVQKVVAAFEFFFGYDLKMITQEIIAIRPDLRDEANWFSTLVNAGIITRNEAREKLRFPKSDDDIADKLVLPANIAGSAANSTQGGRPSNGG